MKQYQFLRFLLININKKQQQSMSFLDTNNSINEILELMKNYKTQEKIKDSTFHDTDKSFSRHYEDSIYHQKQNKQSGCKSDIRLRLHSSVENIQKPKEHLLVVRKKEQKKVYHSRASNIFDRLYDENMTIQNKRQKLIQEGRKSLEDKETKECTFSPNLKLKKAEKNVNPTQIEHFYQKNIDWQNKKQKEIRQMQCQKNNQGVNNLTFTPKINAWKTKNKQNRQDHTILKRKGVEQFLHRQPKTANCIETIEFRKKGAYCQLYNIKRGQFSYLH